ncbi:MAG: NnrS family protein [Chlamydiae bacterium]|nr:NnrS family protein [Chlamydiota bacterium]MBI3265434.1 NnrS family protein [Chlamydiota bacterium]
MPSFKDRFHLFCEDPYRLFFPLAIVMGMVGVGHWLFFALGWTSSYSGFFHSSIQMQAYMASFVVGFLLTSLPRFASLPHATAGELFTFALLIILEWFFARHGWWSLSESCFLGLLMTLGFFAFRRFSKRRLTNLPPVEFVWIPIALLQGAIGVICLILGRRGWGPLFLLKVGKPMLDQGFLMSIVLGVGGFLAPRVMGNFRPMVNAQEMFLGQGKKMRHRNIRLHLFLGFCMFSSFWFEAISLSRVAYLSRAVIVTSSFFLSRSWKFPKAKDFFLWLLWISIWMVILGSWAIPLFYRYRVEMLHIVFIGGFSLMTFSVGTMVVLGHAGESQRLKKPLPVLWGVAIALAMALVLRVVAPFYPKFYFQILGLASFCWISAALSWFGFILLRVFRFVSVHTFEKFHEEAKQESLEHTEKSSFHTVKYASHGAERLPRIQSSLGGLAQEI